MNNGDTLKRPQGDGPFLVKRATFNTIIDAVREYRAGQAARVARQASAEHRDSGIVLVRNNSGADRDRASVLGIGGPVFTPTGGDPTPLLQKLALDCVTPDADVHRGRFAVLLEPIRDSGLGLATVAGLCHVQVDVTDETHQWADVKDADTVSLASGETGTARILWRESGTGIVWAVVLLGASPQTVLLVDSETPEVDGPGLEYVTDADGLERLRTAVQATGGNFGALRFDTDGRLYVALGFGLKDTANGAAVDAAAIAGDGLGEDQPTGKLKILPGTQLVIVNGAVTHDSAGEVAAVVDYDEGGVPMQLLFDAQGHFVALL